jgi:outer membrane protein assembly factor BamE
MPKLHVFRLLILLLVGTIAGCAVYHVDLQQGNVLTDEAVSTLKVGMTKRQVRFLLGTPSITDPFHADRWDYVYYMGKAGRHDGVERRLILRFKDDALSSIDSGLPNTQTGAEAPAQKP